MIRSLAAGHDAYEPEHVMTRRSVAERETLINMSRIIVHPRPMMASRTFSSLPVIINQIHLATVLDMLCVR